MFRPISPGDFVLITNKDFSQYYQIRSINSENKIFISPPDKPDSISTIFFDNQSNRWKIYRTDIDYQIEFLRKDTYDKQQLFNLPSLPENKMIIGDVTEKWIKLQPFLIFDSNKYDYSLKTGDIILDQLIKKRISQDYTKVKDIIDIDEEYDVLSFLYKEPYIYLKISHSNGSLLTKKDFIRIRDEIVDPYDVGPDTWMEGDITIVSKRELANFKKCKNKEGMELGVKVSGPDFLDTIPPL